MKSGIAFGAVSILAFAFTLPMIIDKTPSGSTKDERTAAPTMPTAIGQNRPIQTRTTDGTDSADAPGGEIAGTQNLEAGEKTTNTRLVSTSANAAVEGKLSGNQIYERALRSTVWIQNPGQGEGTGTLVNAQEKLVLTNYHVVFKRNPGDLSSHLVPLRMFSDHLKNFETRDPLTKFPCKYFDVNLAYDKIYCIDMHSIQVESYIEIFNDRGQFLLSSLLRDRKNDPTQTARIVFAPPTRGRYYIMASTFAGGTGGFSLSISEVNFSRIQPPTSAVAPVVRVDFPVHQEGSLVADRAAYRRDGGSFRYTSNAKVIAWCEARDLAVLQLDTLPDNAIAMPLSKRSCQPGQMVHSIGNPGGSGVLWVYTSGTVRTAPYKRKWQSGGGGVTMKHEAWIVETQSATNPGDSGGPLVNENGELAAVTQGSHAASNSISLFVDVREVRAFLGSHGLRWVERAN